MKADNFAHAVAKCSNGVTENIKEIVTTAVATKGESVEIWNHRFCVDHKRKKQESMVFKWISLLKQQQILAVLDSSTTSSRCRTAAMICSPVGSVPCNV
jgi:hypothetical protein